jgi:hypothetical protein
VRRAIWVEEYMEMEMNLGNCFMLTEEKIKYNNGTQFEEQYWWPSNCDLARKKI